VSRIHPLFHVSQLKKNLGASVQVQHQMPSTAVEQIIEPELILRRRMTKQSNQAVAQVLVKWKHLLEDEATWENYRALIRRFPKFDLETRSISSGEY